MASNLRGAPLFLRPSVVRQVVGDLAAIRQAVVRVPLLPIKLVDRPRPSEDPRLAKANDDIAELPVAPAVAGVASGSDRVAPTDASAPVVRIQAEEPEPIGWPDAPLPEYLDPDLDRPEPESEIDSAATRLFNVDRAGDAAQTPEGSSGGVTGGRIDSPANVCEQPTRAPRRTAIDVVIAPRPAEPLRNLGRRRAAQAVEVAEPRPGRERIRAMAEKLAAKRRAEAGIDYAKLAAAHRNSSESRLQSARITRPLEPAPSREECPRCGIPGWKGCDHFLPCADQPAAPGLHPNGGGIARHIGLRGAEA